MDEEHGLAGFRLSAWALVAVLGTRCDSAPSHGARTMCHGIVDYLTVEGTP
jgi:hypothetical protein